MSPQCAAFHILRDTPPKSINSQLNSFMPSAVHALLSSTSLSLPSYTVHYSSLMASSSYVSLCIVFILCSWLKLLSYSTCHGQPMVPALYVFGDSLADVGNNNYLDLSLLKANFPHNGVDFPGHKATGRFSNGNNSADFLASKLQIPSPSPYLGLSYSKNKTAAFLSSVNFASGGAGVLDSTNSGQCISLNKQIDYFSTVYGALVQQLGSAQAQSRLSKSVFALIIGSNDIFNYEKSSSSNKLKTPPPQQFADSLVASLRDQLNRLYNLGARTYVFIGTGPVGCCPSQRQQNRAGDCNAEANFLSAQFNKGVLSLLEELKSELGDMSFVFFDTYGALSEYINDPEAYGFVEVKAACCGLGDLNAKVACVPVATFCPNRRDHMFWDLFHPTEATADLLTSTAFDGSSPYVYPMSIKQLVSA